MRPTKVPWLLQRYRWEEPRPWILDPDFGWLQFSYLPGTDWNQVDAFFCTHVQGYKAGLSPNLRHWILFGDGDLY